MPGMDSILGQDRALGQLQSALDSNRIHHAFVFHGPVGVGKFTTAAAFAKILLCHQRRTDLTGRVGACGTCPSCVRLPHAGNVGGFPGDPGAGAHPDLHVVTKELARYSDDPAIRQRKLLSVSVDVLRSALIEPVYRAPQLGHQKVFVVDEAELLDLRGQNILLKTLEEPPSGTFIILVTSAPEKLLATVRSRCLCIAFVPLPEHVVSTWFDEQKTTNPSSRDWLLRFADGSLGRAQLAVEYDLVKWSEEVLPAIAQMTQNRFDPDLGTTMATLIDTFAKQWVAEHDGASKEAANKQGAMLMWSLISQHARQKLAELAPSADQVSERTEKLLGPWLSVIDALSQAEMELGANVNLGLVCDHLVSTIYRGLSGSTIATGSMVEA